MFPKSLLAIPCLLLGMPLPGQCRGCATTMEYDPTLVLNPKQRVTYVCPEATRLEVIQAVGRQTRLPIGLVLGRHTSAMERERRAYSLRGVDGHEALEEILQGIGYTLHEEDGVLLLWPGTLASGKGGSSTTGMRSSRPAGATA